MNARDNKLLLIAADAKELIKDPQIARLASRLCRAVHKWLTGTSRPSVPAAWFRDADALVTGKHVYGAIAGCRCAGLIARTHEDPDDWLFSLYQKSRGRARMLMLRYAIIEKPRRGNAGDQMIRAGLIDRVLDVRMEACSKAIQWKARAYLPLLQACHASETNPTNREYFEQYVSMLDKGYWLDNKVFFGTYCYEVPTSNGYLYARVSTKAFKSLSEKAVMKRVREAAEDYRSKSAKWLDEINRD